MGFVTMLEFLFVGGFSFLFLFFRNLSNTRIQVTTNLKKGESLLEYYVR